MRASRIFPLIALFLTVLLLAYISAVRAQSPCSHVLFRIDSSLDVDREAICATAEPWREAGIQLYIFLTDEVPASEEAWFALLDQVEAEAGLRIPGEQGGFDRNGLAFEASARSNVPWTNTITFGEDLFDSALDDDDALDQIKAAMFAGLEEGDATAAFSEAITTAHAVAFPPPSRLPLAAGAVGIALLAGGGTLIFLVRPAMKRRRRKQELEMHLGIVQQNVANLLLAAERLLDGSKPQDTILYQLYEANGGTFDAEQTSQLVEWLRRSQAALADAFDLRRDLLAAPAGDSVPDLEKQVQRWEMIYLTLVGSTPRVLELTDSELKDLLNPLVILERKAHDVQLAEQLDAIRREIAGMPLKVDLLEVDPATVDREGILGYIDLTEQAIKVVMDAQRDAPAALQAAQENLAQTEEAADQASPFGLTGSEMLDAIAKRLAEAEQRLEEGNALATMGLLNRANRDLDIVNDLIDAEKDYRQNLAVIEEIAAAGYRPDQLPQDQQEIETDIAKLVAAVRGGDYLAADSWIDELDADSARALAATQAWRERQQFNEESIQGLETRLSAISDLEQEVQPAWQKLQAYPQSNWEDIAPGLPAIARTLAASRQSDLPRIRELNSLAVQDVPQAEALLAATGKAILQSERQLQALINRLDEVRAAEENLPEGLRQGRAELAQATAYRDQEDRRTGPDVDELLSESIRQLAGAAELQAERAFMPAMDRLLLAREKAAAALALAQTQVAEIERLESALVRAKDSAERSNAAALQAADQQPSTAHTTDANARLAAAESALSQARQREAAVMPLEDRALAEGLAAATLLYESAEQKAEEARDQIQRENEAYERLVKQTLAQIVTAEAAIQRAERYVRDRDARGEGKDALQRAKRTLPDSKFDRDSSKQSLQAMLENGRLAESYAQEAERKARVAISYRVPQPGLPLPGMGGSFPRIPGGTIVIGGRPRTSNRSMGKQRSTPAPSMARRSSSFGSGSRSSSMGSSRRSSGGGSRRR